MMKFKIKMETVNNSDRPPFLYIKDRKRPASVTSVKFLDEQTLVCCSFLGRKIYLIRLDSRNGTSHVLDSTMTVYEDLGTETDLCDANALGEVITSNFYKGSFTKYRSDGKVIEFKGDLPFQVNGYVHGVKYYRPDILAITATTNETGVYFFQQDQSDALFHIPVGSKTQDICFLSDNRIIVLTTHGAPKKTHKAMYQSELMLFDIDIPNKAYRLHASTSYPDCHFDCAMVHEGKLYLTDQFNNCVKIFDPSDLRQIGEIPGFDFPHGLDIQHDMMAVTNYGSNDIDIIPMKALEPFHSRVPSLTKFRYRLRYRMQRWKSNMRASTKA